MTSSLLHPPGVVEAGKHGDTAQLILERYPRAKAAAATLGLRFNQSLEQAMRAMQASTELYTRRQFVQVPLYLRQLFWEISQEYTSQPINYTNLINRILGNDFRSIALVTTNYDTFIEQALASVVDARFSTLDSYIADPRWALVKLHGSVDWARLFPGSKAPAKGGLAGLHSYLRILDDIVTTDEEGVTGRLGTTLIPCAQPDLWNESGSLYPALVAPIEGKYEYVCPRHHIDRLRSMVEASPNILVIGSSGLDDDLTDLLREELREVMTFAVVAFGDGRVVSERFRKAVPQLRRVAKEHTHVSDRGFSNFITSGSLAKFLNLIV